MSSLKLEYRINGQGPTSLTQSQTVVLLAGDTVEISAGQDVSWSGASSTPSSVTVSDLQTTPRKWSGQISSTVDDSVRYTITAKLVGASASSKINLELRINAQDRRNGDYQVFATNGTRQTLKLDFDRKTYRMTDAAGVAESGVIGLDATASGTFVFSSARTGGSINNARFRVSLAPDYVVVGAYPFAMPGGTAAVRPFVASRAPIKSPADLDGSFNGLGISMVGTTPDSSINNLRISGRGTTLYDCTDDRIYNTNFCPLGSLKTYSVTKGVTDGVWRAVNNADSSDVRNFSVVKFDDDRVYLEAEQPSFDSFRFRVGVMVDSSTYTSVMTAYGAATDGSWGRSVTKPGRSVLVEYPLARQSSALQGLPTSDDGLERLYTRSAVGLDGTALELSAFVGMIDVLLPVSESTISFPRGLGYALMTPTSYFTARSPQLFARIGPRVPGAAGYLEIGLIER
ncbi:hypothetical protein [Variovorax sp.]|uniref:hypothetical protein n=1 Tax=Variovorax sp. TaxID=1871043 RepID=UPI0025FAEA54|nr:hypothetical protein [Variovorax sp.]